MNIADILPNDPDEALIYSAGAAAILALIMFLLTRSIGGFARILGWACVVAVAAVPIALIVFGDQMSDRGGSRTMAEPVETAPAAPADAALEAPAAPAAPTSSEIVVAAPPAVEEAPPEPIYEEDSADEPVPVETTAPPPPGAVAAPNGEHGGTGGSGAGSGGGGAGDDAIGGLAVPAETEPATGNQATRSLRRRSTRRDGTNDVVDDILDAAEPAETAPAPAAPAVAEDPRFDVVPVFYGTDRARGPDEDRNGLQLVTFTGDRGRRLQLGRADITVPKTAHQVGEVERPFELTVLGITVYREDEDPEKHFTIKAIDVLDEDAFFDQVNARLARSERFEGHAFVFVHGYNVTFESALYRTAQIAFDLDFDGAPFLYSWPSRGEVGGYETDQNNSEQAERYLRRFLDLVMERSNARHIHLIAHSMGNKPLLGVLQNMQVRAEVASDLKINQVILAAPDVDRDLFQDIAAEVLPIARGLTLYASDSDVAMKASRAYAGGVRAGDIAEDGPLIVDGLDTIDVSKASTAVLALNHSTYAERSELLADIGRLMLSGTRPPERRSPVLAPINSNRGLYWQFPSEDQ